MNFDRLQRFYWQHQEQRRDPRHPAVRGFALPKVEVIKKWLTRGNESSLLEIGAGDGYLTYYLCSLGNVVAADFSLPMLRENGCGIRTVADGACLPFAEQAFDLAVEANLLHHVAQPVAIVREMGRVSKEAVVLVEPNRWNPLMLALGVAKSAERKTLSMSAWYLTSLIRAANYELVDLVTEGFITPNRMPLWLVNVLSRWERPSRFAAYCVAVGRRIN